MSSQHHTSGSGPTHCRYEECSESGHVDITLNSCCERDIRERKRIQRLRDILSSKDPTKRRSEALTLAVVRDAERIPLACPVDQNDIRNSSEEEDDRLLGACEKIALAPFDALRICISVLNKDSED